MTMKSKEIGAYSATEYTEDILKEAFSHINEKFISDLPEQVEEHVFSKKFHRKMKKLLRANQYFGGKIWVEKTVRFSLTAATVMICLFTLNQAVVQAFHFNLWEMVATKTGTFVNIHFVNQSESAKKSEVVTKSGRCRIVTPPEGYTFINNDIMENMTVQNLVSDYGTISCLESEIAKTAEIYVAAVENGEAKNVNGWEVTYITSESAITGVFCDEKYYHILTIQGADANEEFLNTIIKKLEVK